MSKVLVDIEFSYRGIRIEKNPVRTPYTIQREDGKKFYFISLAEAQVFIDTEFALHRVAVRVFGGERALIML
jgi:hypothetical protein